MVQIQSIYQNGLLDFIQLQLNNFQIKSNQILGQGDANISYQLKFNLFVVSCQLNFRRFVSFQWLLIINRKSGTFVRALSIRQSVWKFPGEVFTKSEIVKFLKSEPFNQNVLVLIISPSVLN